MRILMHFGTKVGSITGTDLFEAYYIKWVKEMKRGYQKLPSRLQYKSPSEFRQRLYEASAVTTAINLNP